jgi:hypothetical protein
MEKHKYQIELPEHVVEAFMEEDDLKCQFRLGAEVLKTNSEEGDLNADGAKGLIIGNLSEDFDGESIELYLVLWEGLIDFGPIGTTGRKLKLA